ncbi:hypothetical protein PPOLYM_01775 [Paenibacillus polymyxa]|uniref:DUF1697 domain-containing protein n=1 Tax=Paenibacillus polymyxa TaxID=1406 RepID=A0AAP4EC72_PAEPO|nr:DUF1697 domain-containing protein [Paenibacillus polymyxa]APQ60545.1 hypothetical protein VK72_18365 [Paenibacillus polymyxa]MDH2333770.1 DUF1697 domain-containing protein [Paenibacillus polymyxa]VUG05395.1 hypothetical protein PPOLYM_01775 [Paenibacillus polymyxa]
MIYIALLRGINVGGNNKIEMKKLKQTFENAGLGHVTTYINSGNIIFSSQGDSNEELSLKLEQAILEDFSLPIRVIVRNMKEIQSIMEALPNEWSNDTQMKSDVLFLWDEINDISVLDKLPLKPGIGHVIYTTGAVLYSVSKQQVTKSGLTKLVGTKLYQQMTVRNVNTTRQINKLMQMAEQEELRDTSSDRNPKATLGG